MGYIFVVATVARVSLIFPYEKADVCVTMFDDCFIKSKSGHVMYLLNVNCCF